MNNLGKIVVRGILAILAGLFFVVAIVAFGMSFMAHENYKTSDALRNAYQQSQHDCMALVTNKSSERRRSGWRPNGGYDYYTAYFVHLEIQEQCSSIMQGTPTVSVSKIAYDAVSVHDEIEIYEVDGKIRFVKELEKLAEPPDHTTKMIGAISIAACVVILCLRVGIRRPELSKHDQMHM